MEENKNIPTTEGEAIAPEAPVTDIPGTDAPSPDLTAGVPQQEQTGATMAEPGDVVVSFDKIEELMAERRAAARDTVEKAEPAAPEVDAPAVEPVEPIPAAKEPEKTTEEKPQEEVAAEQKKSRRGRPPKAEKAEQGTPEADKEQTAAKPRRGRPPKADKAAPDEAQPPKPRDKVGPLTKSKNIACCGKIKEKAGGVLDATEAAHGDDRGSDTAGTLFAEAGKGAGSVLRV